MVRPPELCSRIQDPPCSGATPPPAGRRERPHHLHPRPDPPNTKPEDQKASGNSSPTPAWYLISSMSSSCSLLPWTKCGDGRACASPNCSKARAICGLRTRTIFPKRCGCDSPVKLESDQACGVGCYRNVGRKNGREVSRHKTAGDLPIEFRHFKLAALRKSQGPVLRDPEMRADSALYPC